MTAHDLTAWRDAHHYSRKALARALGVAPSTVTRWERGDFPVAPWVPVALDGLLARAS